MGKKVLVITDNLYLTKQFRNIVSQKEELAATCFDYAHSFDNRNDFDNDYKCVDIKRDPEIIISKYNLIISLHCKQIFPQKVVDGVLCINIHPGYNPYNRGWYPQVFSIINKKPIGATIHIIDNELDHGAIIAQKKVESFNWDTSLSLYNRVLQTELELIDENIVDIVNGTFSKMKPCVEGNVNLKSDFNKLCKIDKDEIGKMSELIDKLRALSHGDYKNAYFIDNNGQRIFIKIELEPEGGIQ